MPGFEHYPQINVYTKDSLVGTVYFEQLSRSNCKQSAHSAGGLMNGVRRFQCKSNQFGTVIRTALGLHP